MASSPQHEPTMEEILASIRKIISEDSTEAPPAAAEPKPAPVAAAPAPVEADVLELTQEIPEEPAPAPCLRLFRRQSPLRSRRCRKTMLCSRLSRSLPSCLKPLSARMTTSFRTRRAKPWTIPSPISTNRNTMRHSSGYGTAPIAPVSGLTVEAVFERAVREAFDPVVAKWLGANTDMIVDRMKPLIREWMDEHFPALLEGAVRNEVARVVKARGAKR